MVVHQLQVPRFEGQRHAARLRYLSEEIQRLILRWGVQRYAKLARPLLRLLWESPHTIYSK